MGDDETRDGELRERGVDRPLVLQVEVRGALVQDQDPGAAVKCAGDQVRSGQWDPVPTRIYCSHNRRNNKPDQMPTAHMNGTIARNGPYKGASGTTNKKNHPSAHMPVKAIGKPNCIVALSTNPRRVLSLLWRTSDRTAEMKAQTLSNAITNVPTRTSLANIAFLVIRAFLGRYGILPKCIKLQLSAGVGIRHRVVNSTSYQDTSHDHRPCGQTYCKPEHTARIYSLRKKERRQKASSCRMPDSYATTPNHAGRCTKGTGS